MQEHHTLVRMDQEDKNKASKDMMQELNAAVTRLQEDIVEQNDVNSSQ
jgi:enoyl-CoA hydratase/carnithine racemase